MKKIPLNKKQFATVDDADFEYLSQWKWGIAKRGTNTYAARGERVTEGGIRGKIVYMHRQLLGLTDSEVCADHIDHDGLNNQRHNLRTCTRGQNIMNRVVTWGASKYKGVWWSKEKSKWAAEIRFNGNKRHLGYFKSEANAGNAYNVAAKQLFGEFACQNKL